MTSHHHRGPSHAAPHRPYRRRNLPLAARHRGHRPRPLHGPPLRAL